MLFASQDFVFFLIVLIFLYYGPCRKFQWQLILLASYIFYYFSGVTNLFYIAFTTVTTYLLTRAMQKVSDETSAFVKSHKEDMSREERKAYKASRKKILGRLLFLDILCNIGLLAVVKYTNFTISNINAVMSAFGSKNVLGFWDIALPMGISFYVFQSVGYAIDVYRGKVRAERNFFKLACFISFFPQLVQGPISRFDDLTETLFTRHEYDFDRVKSGALRVLWGFFKKLVIADRLLVAVNTIIHDPENYYGAFVFVGMVFYGIELYADFTGGIDITIGVAEILGIRVKENFKRPYFSKSIKEFWNRWHITMGTWFTDYIFYPLSVSKWMLKLSHNSREKLGDKFGKRVPVYLSSLIVWFATGLWHGASWNFIVWGIGNFVIIMISQELTPFYRWFHSKCNVEGKKSWSAFQIIRTIFIMSSLRTFDCYRDVPLTFRMYGSMFTRANFGNVIASWNTLGLEASDYVVVMLGVILMFAVSMISRGVGMGEYTELVSGDIRPAEASARGKLFAKGYWTQFAVIFLLFLVVLIFGNYGIGFDSSQFIYNQF